MSAKRPLSSYSATGVDNAKRLKTTHTVGQEDGDCSLEAYVEPPDISSDSEIPEPLDQVAPQTVAAPKVWTLNTDQIPLNAKKVYCVLRGREPGFYFDYPTGAEPQVRGFTGNLFMSFPQDKKASIKAYTKDQIVKEAVAYMNHGPESCIYSCAGKCRSDMTTTAAPTTSVASSRLAPSAQRRPGSCTECGERAPPKPAKVCDECMTSSDMLSRLDACSANFTLDAEQSQILRLVASGRNVFFTGAAGTGKSRTIEAIVEYLKGARTSASVVAPTGMAALHVFGTTLHMFAGWTVKHGQSKLEDLAQVAYEKKVRSRILSTDVLIIDEISMVENHMLRRLSFVCSEARRSAAPFGGIQLIVTGDFFQLPPVLPFKTCLDCGEDLEESADGLETKICSEHGEHRDEDKWPFRSQLWSDLDFANVKLTQVHRQSDSVFTDLLHSLREGQLTDEQKDLLLHHPNDVVVSKAVKLCPLRREVEHINDFHMKALSGPVHRYERVDDLRWQQVQHRQMYKSPMGTLHNHRYSDELELKEGMQVILLYNLDSKAGLVNGSSGKIIGFEEMRDPTLQAQSSKDPEPEIPKTHKHSNYKQQQIRNFRTKNQSQHWPIVEFEGGVRRTIYSHCSVTELGQTEPYSLLSRTQIPLIAGWAITIHKSQGMTLSNVVVNLEKAFAPGQTYVALSRAKSLRQMVVQTLPAVSTVPDRTVQEFMKATFG